MPVCFKMLRGFLDVYSQKEKIYSLVTEKLDRNKNRPGLVLSDLNLFYDEKFITIGLDFLQEKLHSESCSSQEFNVALKLLSNMEITVSEFELDRQSKVNFLSTKHYFKGDVVEMKRGNIYDVLVKNGGTVMIAKQKDKDDVKYIYDKRTGALNSVISTKNEYSRLQFAAKLLGKYPDRKSLNNLRNLIEHNAHFVRWEAAQAFALIAEKHEIKQMLEELSNDVHPHIQNAAIKSLAMLREV